MYDKLVVKCNGHNGPHFSLSGNLSYSYICDLHLLFLLKISFSDDVSVVVSITILIVPHLVKGVSPDCTPAFHDAVSNLSIIANVYVIQND